MRTDRFSGRRYASITAAVAAVSMLAGFALAACSGPKAKPESPLVKEGSAVPETCCCKHTPIGEATVRYEDVGRMDCSGKHGDCVDAVQCEKQPVPPSEGP